MRAILGALVVASLGVMLAVSGPIPFSGGPGGPVQRSVTVSPGAVETLQFECWASPNNPVPASALVTAMGSAAGWVTPSRLGCGAMDPGDDFDLNYTLTVPRNQSLGQYQLIWNGTCGPGCTYVSPELVTITVSGPAGSAGPASTVLLVALAAIVVLVAAVALRTWQRQRAAVRPD